jgi:hypothetical protein
VLSRQRAQANADAWGGAKSFAVARGPPAQDDDMRYLKSIALHLWLFGYEVPGARPSRALCQPRVRVSAPCSRPPRADTILLFTPDAMHVVLSSKKGARRRRQPREAVGPRALNLARVASLRQPTCCDPWWRR